VIHGDVAPGFEPVLAAFERNLTTEDEVAASFGQCLTVNCWADRLSGKPWKRDPSSWPFSGTKGFVAVCILMLIERGQLELDAPVSRDWPEFGGRGKSGIRVQEVVSHRPGSPQ
jgi:hypothetical protein